MLLMLTDISRLLANFILDFYEQPTATEQQDVYRRLTLCTIVRHVQQ